MSSQALTFEEDRLWRTFLHASTGLMSRLDQEMRTAHGVPLSDFDVLSNLSEASGEQLRMSDLADQTLFSRSRLSYTVSQLETRGFVKRQQDATDKRGVIASLTRNGRAYHRELAKTHVDGIRRHFFDRTTLQGRTLLAQFLAPIAEELEANQPPHETAAPART